MGGPRKTKKIASIHLNTRISKWELWYQSRPIATGISWEDMKLWGEDHGYNVVGPRADDVDQAETERSSKNAG